MDYPSKAKAMLEADIADMAAHAADYAARPGRDFTRERKLGFADLVTLLVTMGTGSVSHELMEHFSYDPQAAPSKSALCQRRACLAEGAMRHLLRAFSSRFGLGEYRDGYSLVAVDGSSFCFGPDPSDPTTFHESREGCRGHNIVHAVALYDMVAGSYIDAVVQRGREKNEYAAMCGLVDAWDRGGAPIFVGDRGFASYNVFAHIIEAGHLFLVRASDRRAERIRGRRQLPDELDETVSRILARSKAKAKRLEPERGEDYRFVSKEAAFDFIDEGRPEYEVSLRVVRFAVGDGFENIVTNLPAGEFGPGELKEMYRMRWGIETSFRRLKLNIGAAGLHSKRAAWVTQEVFARMVLYDFCAAVARYVALLPGVAGKRGRRHAHKVNFADAARACCAFLRGRARGPDVEELVAGSTLPVRPGRSFHRRHRLRSPSGYAYRSA